MCYGLANKFFSLVNSCIYFNASSFLQFTFSHDLFSLGNSVSSRCFFVEWPSTRFHKNSKLRIEAVSSFNNPNFAFINKQLTTHYLLNIEMCYHNDYQ